MPTPTSEQLVARARYGCLRLLIELTEGDIQTYLDDAVDRHYLEWSSTEYRYVLGVSKPR